MDKSVKLFYTPPKDECFEELRTICIRFWRTFDEVEYVEEKINRIKNLKNEGCNFVMMVQMIHAVSREVIAKALSLETRNEISMRLHGWEKENEFDFYFFFEDDMFFYPKKGEVCRNGFNRYTNDLYHKTLKKRLNLMTP